MIKAPRERAKHIPMLLRSEPRGAVIFISDQITIKRNNQ